MKNPSMKPLSMKSSDISKFLSFVLRHEPQSIQLDMDEQGFVFYCTDNQVWLTDTVPGQFIHVVKG